MTTLLQLDSSANRSDESITRRLTARYAAAWRARHDAAGHRYRDLAVEPVAPLDTAYCALGRRAERHGLVPLAEVDALVETDAEARAWALTRPLIHEVRAADTVLIGAPMYNYSIPAALKAWIDRISFPGAFIDPDSGESVLRDTTVVIVASRGGSYGAGTRRAACDFQLPYLRAYFARHGVPEVRVVTAELTLADLAPHLAALRPAAAESLSGAAAELRALVR